MILLLVACQSHPDLDTPTDSIVEVPDDTPTDSTPPDDTDSGGGDTECPDSCDDGLDCTEDACDAQGRCVSSPLETCEWPASVPPDVIALAGLDTDFRISLSGATWNATTRELWVVRGDGAEAWRLVEDGNGLWVIDDGGDANWSLGRLDLESVVVVDPIGAPALIHVIVELDEVVTAFDLSELGNAQKLRTWDTTPWLKASGSKGSEGMTFVPDDALAEWGFVDGDGAPRTSVLGYGGLFFVATQNGGGIHVFDLSATDDAVDFVGSFETAWADSSGLEFDAGTGRLYVWHGGDDDDLEVVRLSSTESGGARSFDVEAVFDYPGTPNIEGIALAGIEDCKDGVRSLFFTIDDGGDRALDVYTDWPLCRP